MIWHSMDEKPRLDHELCAVAVYNEETPDKPYTFYAEFIKSDSDPGVKFTGEGFYYPCWDFAEEAYFFENMNENGKLLAWAKLPDLKAEYVIKEIEA